MSINRCSHVMNIHGFIWHCKDEYYFWIDKTKAELF